MQYSVPQFIETEDRVVGPLTLRQFFVLLGGGIFLALIYSLVDLGLFIFLVIVTAAIVIPFTFIKINGRRFGEYLSSVIKFYTKPQMRYWHKITDNKAMNVENLDKRQRVNPSAETIGEKSFSKSKLNELSLILDTEKLPTYGQEPAKENEINKEA